MGGADICGNGGGPWLAEDSADIKAFCPKAALAPPVLLAAAPPAAPAAPLAPPSELIKPAAHPIVAPYMFPAIVRPELEETAPPV